MQLNDLVFAINAVMICSVIMVMALKYRKDPSVQRVSKFGMIVFGLTAAYFMGFGVLCMLGMCQWLDFVSICILYISNIYV